ncbi:MAG TPA: hypothetical protein VH092_30260 [Urbifossiella sp.]|nr:hypothetical protein [Urbifossiella sp.]
MLVLHGAIGLTCLGGILWCTVRVAYPDGPPGDAPPGRPVG